MIPQFFQPSVNLPAAMTTNTPLTTPKVLIIIVTWNKKFYVLQLLNSLKNINYPNEAIDIVVVDNASNDDTVPAIQQQYPQVHLIQNSENVGGTGGFNTGMQWAFDQPDGQYEYLWLLDNDVMVHCNALSQLVNILESHADISIAGSTMMQLDYPWRINEMGCFFDFMSGTLILNRHHEELPVLRSRSPESLAADDTLSLTHLLMHCQAFMDVDYVAAASLLIRMKVAKDTGLWKDFFIHFDDVEWCLRIGEAGHRIVVAADSIIWHLSAAAKVPTWVLYYDNRNMLVTLRDHGASKKVLCDTMRRTLQAAKHYALIGKPDISRLHKAALDDFLNNQLGKKDIKLDAPYQPNQNISKVLMDSRIKRILIGDVNLQATHIQMPIMQALQQRQDLQVTCLTQLNGLRIFQLPRAKFLALPSGRLRRWWHYWKLRDQFDLVIQSDYASYPVFSWLSPQIIFINDDGFCVRPRPHWRDVWQAWSWWWQFKWRGAFCKQLQLDKRKR